MLLGLLHVVLGAQTLGTHISVHHKILQYVFTSTPTTTPISAPNLSAHLSASSSLSHPPHQVAGGSVRCPPPFPPTARRRWWWESSRRTIGPGPRSLWCLRGGGRRALRPEWPRGGMRAR
ncbi:hypothetical protein F4809DRAFT_135932 [Biscogniauxia mediterranea]|nr:hypothetical protein F4809DRAFT_135932 [Biscogniauxia mediterranea]